MTKTEKKTASYYAEYWSTDGKTLLGGVLRSQSCRYQDPLEAQHRLDQVLALHPGRCTGQVKTSTRYPEIFRHCGSDALPSQAIGGHCFNCKKLLTVADAKAAQKG
jgi:hypothetical protein